MEEEEDFVSFDTLPEKDEKKKKENKAPNKAKKSEQKTKSEQVNEKSKEEGPMPSSNQENISPKELEKQQWAIKMRLKFTNSDMINSDGTLNQE